MAFVFINNHKIGMNALILLECFEKSLNPLLFSSFAGYGKRGGGDDPVFCVLQP